MGTGPTLAEAAAKALKAGAPRNAKAIATLALNDAEPWVSTDGMINTAATATLLYLGAVGTVGSILNANKAQK